MNASARNELNSIIRELNSIIAEMEDISRGIRADFKGIGENQCSNCIDRVITQYRNVRNSLNRIDTSSHANTGGGGFR